MRRNSSNSSLLGLHQQEKWDVGGGWTPNSVEKKKEYNMERDASMVNLLNMFDPQSLVDSQTTKCESREQKSSQRGLVRSHTVGHFEQHSALSNRGLATVGSMSALGWYLLRLILRDLVKAAPTWQQQILELHLLTTIHSIGWIGFLVSKIFKPSEELPMFCSRALVASLGFYLHDCWALRATAITHPTMLLHSASMAATVASILRSKGVAWLGPFLMCETLPTLLQEFLRVCGTVGIPATRPEVRFLRILWITTFSVSKVLVVPVWMKFRELPEFHQPNLWLGKLSYAVCAALNVQLMVSAAQNLPKFLAPRGAQVSAATAYRKPLRRVQSSIINVVGSVALVGVFGAYFIGPLSAALGMLSVSAKFGSRRLRILAASLLALVAADIIVPQPKEFSPTFARWAQPLMRAISWSFRHKLMPEGAAVRLDKNRSHLLALTPHGFMPWGVAPVLADLVEHGYQPNFVGASALGALPIVGRMFRAFGYKSATRSAIAECLAKPYPQNVTIILPGGIAEMFLLREDLEISATSTRKGFAEVAIKNGAVLTPGYMLGNSQLYKVAQGSIGAVFEKISRSLRLSLNLFHGRWGTLLPYPHDLACALGEPIDTREITDVDTVHRLWIQGLRKTFDEHKAEFGWDDRQLYFVDEKIPDPPKDDLEEYTDLPFSRL